MQPATSITTRILGRWVALAALAAVGLAACGGSTGGNAPAASSRPNDHVILRLSFVHTGLEAPLAYGIAKGYFAQNGIDLELADGKGSATTIQTVANGADDFGEVDGGTLITLGTKGVPAKAVMGYVDGTVLAILTSESAGITNPKQLEGKTVGITAGDAPGTLLPAVFDSSGVDKSKVKLINMTPPVKLSALATKSADAVATLNLVAGSLESKGVKVHTMLYSDYGITTPGYVLVASNDAIARKADLVRRFVKAAAMSREGAARNPRAAIDAYVKRYPDYNRDIATREQNIILPLLNTPATKGKPSGYIAKQDMQKGYDVLVRYSGIATGKKADDFFTDQFIPAK